MSRWPTLPHAEHRCNFLYLVHAVEAHLLPVQVNWGLFSGKYLTAAVGSARSYVQVCAATCGSYV